MANQRKAGKKSLVIWTSDSFLKKVEQFAKQKGVVYHGRGNRSGVTEQILIEAMVKAGVLPPDYDPAEDLPGAKKRQRKKK